MAAAVKDLTNAFVTDGRKVLLGLKKRGFGAGKWNGFGGKLSPGESPLEAAQREFMEEAGVVMKDPELVGKVSYSYVGMEKVLRVYVYKASCIEPDEPTESEEMKPEWFDVGNIPFQDMWADDEHWYPLLLAGGKFQARFDFDQDMKTILNKVVIPLEKEKDLDSLEWL